MLHLSDLKKVLLGLPMAIIMNAYCLNKADGSLDITLNQLYLTSFFDVQRQADGSGRLVVTFMSMAGILFFSIICGMEIYKECSTTGVYTLVRVEKRKTWFAKLIARLLEMVLMYSLLYSIVTLVLHLHYTGEKINIHTVPVLFFSVWYLFYMVSVISLVINFASMWKNTMVGCFSGTLVLILMISCSLFFNDIPVIKEYPNLWYLNPINMINLYQNIGIQGYIGYMLYYSVLLFGAIFIVVGMTDKLDVGIFKEQV
ncbi:MAG: hypothetical protein IIY81_06690 [Lachnospiraceae bacterium]|nr:hypothetical protein [Lachnospiraceae bacterium]